MATKQASSNEIWRGKQATKKASKQRSGEAGKQASERGEGDEQATSKQRASNETQRWRASEGACSPSHYIPLASPDPLPHELIKQTIAVESSILGTLLAFPGLASSAMHSPAV
jgi:hypothetical protein